MTLDDILADLGSVDREAKVRDTAGAPIGLSPHGSDASGLRDGAGGDRDDATRLTDGVQPIRRSVGDHAIGMTDDRVVRTGADPWRTQPPTTEFPTTRPPTTRPPTTRPQTTRPPTPPLAILRHLLFPPACLACDARVQTEWALCPACWADTPFLARHVCPTCAAPLPGEPGPGDACDDCLAAPRPWGRAAAALRYGDRGRDLVLRLKHADRTDLAVPLGTWLARRAAPLVTDRTVLVPVPLHPRRLLARRYNQAALVARVMGRRLGRPVWADALRRRRATPPLDDATHAERRALLQGTMDLHPRHRGRLAGRDVLLVDDVLTSGATLHEATRAALAAGAARVDVAVVARAARAV